MKKGSDRKSSKGQKFNPHHKPENMSLEEWQVALRRQVAKKERFVVKPVDFGREGYFSVTSPQSHRRYSVVYRGEGSRWNYCSCPDFQTNQLGTCKHLEAVGLTAGGKYAKKSYHLPFCTTVYLDYKGKRRVCLRLGGAHKDEISRLASDYFDRHHVLSDDKFDLFGEFMQKAKAIDPLTRCFDDAFDYIIRVREDHRRAKLAESEDNLFDGLLKVDLYPYQREGAEFIFKQGRAVVADEMGLGKTIQAIAATMLLRKNGLAGSVWVVCPTSLKYQWKNEIKKFTGEDALAVEGDVVKRVDLLCTDPAFFKIVSYQSLTNSINFGLKSMPDMIIYDEVQRLKNWDTKMAVAMRRLTPGYVVALSGTPLENKLTELYSVMQLVDQFALGPYWKFVAETTEMDPTGRVTGYKNLNKVGLLLKSRLIRRTKKSVELQMPSRIDKNLFVPVTKEQMAVHDDCKWNVGALIAKWRKVGFLSETDRRRLMLNLSMMRMVADSTFILDQKSRHDTKIDEAVSIIGEVIASGDEKIVIFSQWERMQRVMAGELEKRGIGFRFLHGGVPSQKRGAMINDFISDTECRVFLSTDAGSTGLNLQAASIVINFDLPWNPAVLEQRIGRVYRIGQTRQVQVINMISVGTIEQNMLDTLAFKTGLFEGVLDGGEDAVVLNEKKFDRIVELVDKNVDFEAPAYSGETVDAEENDSDGVMLTDDIPVAEVESLAQEENYEEIADADEYDGGYDSDRMTSPADEPDATAQTGQTDQIDHVDSDATALVAKGMEFLGGLAKALSTEESRRRFVDSIVKEDPVTGKMSLSIPVADKATVGNVIEMFAGLLTSLRK